MSSFTIRFAVYRVMLLAFLGALSSHAATMYSIQNLLVPGANWSGRVSINDSGRVVGSFVNAGGAVESYIWDSGVLTTLPSLTPAGMEGISINNSGSIAGNYFSSPLGSGYRPFVSNGSTITPLGTLGGSRGIVLSINDTGTMTGGSDLSGDIAYHATIWQNDQILDLGTLPGGLTSFGTNINTAGQITGSSNISTSIANVWHAFFWDGNQMLDLGTLGGAVSFGLALNDSGQVVGNSLTEDPNSGPIAFLWNGTSMVGLGHLGGMSSTAFGINSLGTVVGTSIGTDGIESRAFVWDGGTMRDLNNAVAGGGGWQLREARDINDRGQIVGTGLYNGQFAAFVLSPVAEVPEPNEIFVVGLAVIGMAGIKRILGSA